jgi:site-specific recombinase XerD
MLERAAESARLDIKAHPHMLRHACGYALANKGYDTRGLQAYLGHRYIQHTGGIQSYRQIGSKAGGKTNGKQ